MELRQLRYFTAVATELSFTKAAEKLHISQPPLSHQIGALEEEIGAKLLIRTSRSVQLSEAGKALLPHVQAVFARLDQGLENVRRVEAGLTGRVEVGLTGSHFLGPLPRFIKQFRSERPDVQVVLREMPPVEQLAGVGDMSLDVSFSRGVPADDGLISRHLWADSTVVALPLGHPLAKRKRLTLGDLRDEDFVFMRVGSSLFVDAVSEACIAARFQPRIVQQVIEVPAALNLVAAGLGVAIVPGSIAHLRRREISICRLVLDPRGPTICADVHLVHRASESNPAVLHFVTELAAWAKHLDIHRLAPS